MISLKMIFGIFFGNYNYKATVKMEIFVNFLQPCFWIGPRLELNLSETLIHLQSKYHENPIGSFWDITDTDRHIFCMKMIPK